MEEATTINKNTIRKLMLNQRSTLSDDLVKQLSIKAQQNLIRTNYWQNAKSIAIYMAKEKEISTIKLLNDAWNRKVPIYLPRTNKEKKGYMDFVKCSSLNDLVLGAFKILEPNEHLPNLTDTKAPLPDIFILPGLAFDHKGIRLGYGKGYYDRYLHENTNSFYIGLCYNFQYIEHIECDTWDKKVNAICTDERFICL